MRRFFVSVILISSLLITGCFFQQKEYSDTRFLMDTLVKITVYGQNQKALETATTEAFNVFKSVADATDSYEEHLPDDLYTLNKKAGEGPFKVNPTLLDLLTKTEAFHHKEINLALGKVIAIWQAHGQTKTVPTKAEIQTALLSAKSGAFTINETDGTVTLAPQASLDLGAVAKGYGVEAAANALKKHPEVESALVNGGGNIKVIGTKKDGKPWRIGIQNPRDNKKLLGTLSLTANMAVATSGDYQRYYEVDGVRYHHIIDPATGFPARHTISATAVTTSAYVADYYSTLLFILPTEEAIKLVESTDDLEAVIEDAQGKIYVSPGLKDKFSLAK